MKVLGYILAILGIFIVVTLIRAIFFKEKKTNTEKLAPEMIDMEKYCRDLSDAIKIKTISNYDRELVDWSEFDRFHAFLEERFPLVHKNMTKTKVADASLVYKWEGTDPSLDGIAMLAHQDVVPITAGTEQDWEHEPFSGYNDGEFIWGRGAMDMKNHLIAVMECMEELLNEGFQPKRTVYICLGHNEEVVAAPDNGAKQIAAYLKEQGVHLEAVLDEFDNIVGLDRLYAIHMNDSKNPFESHKDRHEKIGEGSIGLSAMKAIINNPRLKNLPIFLETPNELDGYAKEIKILKENYIG